MVCRPCRRPCCVSYSSIELGCVRCARRDGPPLLLPPFDVRLCGTPVASQILQRGDYGRTWLRLCPRILRCQKNLETNLALLDTTLPFSNSVSRCGTRASLVHTLAASCL